MAAEASLDVRLDRATQRSGPAVGRVLSRLLGRICALVVAAAMTGTAGASESVSGVGFVRSSTTDPMGGRMQYSIWYPTAAPDGVITIGPFEFPGTRDADPAAGPFGLVVLSHGSGGSDLSHWDTAVALARAGFIAAAPLHPRNNFRHDVGDDRRIVLDGRPRQLAAVIDALLSRTRWSTRIDPERIAAFGFSAGGYAVLAGLGAAPEYTRTLEHCARHAEDDPYCRIVNAADGETRAARARAYAEPVAPFRDGRLCAAVLADPFAVPFSDAALRSMPPARLLFLRPQVEDVIKAAFHSSRVIRVLAQRDDFPRPLEILVPDAGHFSFLAPVPEAVGRILAAPDPFDRQAFRAEMSRRVALHAELNAAIVAFFREALPNCTKNGR